MSDLFQALFVAVRQACTSHAWSRGIELARSDGVDGVEQDDEQVVLLVKSPGQTVAPSVTLYPEDEEWVCDCDSIADACEHAAAAIIALRRARKEGKALPVSARAGGRLRYVLVAENDRLAIERQVVSSDGTAKPLGASLGAVLSGRSDGPAVEPTKVDLSIDRLLGMWRVRSLTADRLSEVLSLLARADDVELDGQAVVVMDKPLRPLAIVEDAPGGGFVLRFTAPPDFERVVMAGLVCCRDSQGARTLWGVADPDLTGLRLEHLPRQRLFGPAMVATLVSKVIPELRDRAVVDVRTSALPDAVSRQPVRPVVDIQHRGAALSLLACVEYGEPACARVVDGELLHLSGPIPRRDERAEQRVVASLREQLDLVAGRRSDFLGEEAVAKAEALRSWAGVVRGGALLARYPQRPLEAELELDPDHFGVRFAASSDADLTADPAAVLEAWQRGSEHVALTGGGWARIPRDWLGQHGHRIGELLAARQQGGSLDGCGRVTLARLCDSLERPRPLSLRSLAPLIDGFSSLPRVALPSDLTATLRPYQQQGVDWLCFLRAAGLGGVLADDMGLGKTLQALCAVSGRTLVVCPRSVVHNWVAEIERFRPALEHCVYHGARRQLDDEAAITITTYALLRGDIELLAAERWDCVVLDEAQLIKNPDSQVARAAYRLEAGFRLSLSGTPIENRLEELWSQLHFTNRGLLAGRQSFRERYERPILAGEAGSAARLRERIGPFVLRREKRQVATELPERSEAVMCCELDEQERETYEAIRLATKRKVAAQLEQGGNVMAVLEALLRMRQAACDITLVPGHGQRREPSSKIKRLLMALEQAASDGHKALVFSQWTSLLDRVQPQLDQAGIDTLRLDGSTVDRASVVERFQAQGGPPVLLLSLKAGGTGLNLTAADHVFLLDPWWNPATEDQAADRAHRIGQERPVMVYRMVAVDTVEERILALQQRKRSLADAALGDAQRAASLTREDLLALIG